MALEQRSQVYSSEVITITYYLLKNRKKQWPAVVTSGGRTRCCRGRSMAGPRRVAMCGLRNGADLSVLTLSAAGINVEAWFDAQWARQGTAGADYWQEGGKAFSIAWLLGVSPSVSFC
jgi:hypothetical protein